MKRYTLTSSSARKTVDLREYADVITDAVTSIMSDKDVDVVVYKDSYTVSPTPSQGEAIRIGRMICKSKLNRHCIQISKLFTGVEIEAKEKSNESIINHSMGGHH